VKFLLLDAEISRNNNGKSYNLQVAKAPGKQRSRPRRSRRSAQNKQQVALNSWWQCRGRQIVEGEKRREENGSFKGAGQMFLFFIPSKAPPIHICAYIPFVENFMQFYILPFYII